MDISDEEKRQIMRNLAQGNSSLPKANTSASESQQDFDPQDYSNFDDFAQRPTAQVQTQDNITQAFFDELKGRGLNDPRMES